jgi:hypothetical protein
MAARERRKTVNAGSLARRFPDSVRLTDLDFARRLRDDGVETDLDEDAI